MSREIVRAEQCRWAERKGLAVTANGYLASVDLNLFRAPMSPSTHRAFELADGSELLGRNDGPPKMAALHSSSALAVNFFDHWCDRDPAPVANALGLGPQPWKIEFEHKAATGLKGKSPNLDLLFRSRSASVVGVESKFTEWMIRTRRTGSSFKPKYFAGPALWAGKGLTQAQTLAEGLHSRRIAFEWLGAAQLLKHMLGLATQFPPGTWRLVYLYYDVAGPMGDSHRHDLNEFAIHIDASVGFEALSYQELFRRLSARVDVEPAYLSYMRDRYFSADQRHS